MIVAWNHIEFEVRYDSLAEEVKIGKTYVHLFVGEGREVYIDIWYIINYITHLIIIFLIYTYCHFSGDHYLRLLLENDPKTTRIHNPVEFFNDLYHRFLLTTVPSMKSMCLQVHFPSFFRFSGISLVSLPPIVILCIFS